MPTPFGDVFTQLGDKFSEFVSVKDFGAKGGLSDDTDKFQDALNSGESHILIPPGSYNLSQITIPPTVHALIGYGPGATFLNCVDTMANFQPWMYFDAIAGIEFSGFTINQPKASYGLNHALNFGSCTDGLISNLRFNEAGFFAVYMAGCNLMEVRRVTVASYANTAIAAEINSSKIKIKDCAILSPGTGHAIAATGSSHEITDNYVYRSGASCFGIAIGASDSIVSRNRVHTNTIEGINLQDASRVSITDNIVFCETGHLDFGISIYAANAPVEACLVSGNRTYNSGSSGIGIASTNYSNAYCRYNRISDNHVMNPCQNAANIPALGRGGINLYGPQTAANTVANNTIVDQASNMLYGVNEWDDSLGAPSYNHFIHNNVPAASALIAVSHNLAATTKVWDLP